MSRVVSKTRKPLPLLRYDGEYVPADEVRKAVMRVRHRSMQPRKLTDFHAPFNFTKAFDDILDRPAGLRGEKRVGDIVAEAAVVSAADGSFPHLKEIIERTDGKIPDKVYMSQGVPELDLTQLSSEELEELQSTLSKCTTNLQHSRRHRMEGARKIIPATVPARAG